MKAKLNEEGTLIEVDVSKLITPEYYQKEKIEGRELQLLLSIERNGITQPIVINRHKGRENIVVNGVNVVDACKELHIKFIPAYVIDVPLDKEKEIHVVLNNNISVNPKEIIKKLLNATFEDYFFDVLSFNDQEKAALDGNIQPPQTKMKDRVKAITSHVNHKERENFELVKEYLKCKTDSQTVKELVNHFLTLNGLV